MVIAKIHNVFKNLTGTEQKIASYILEFPEKIVNMTAEEQKQLLMQCALQSKREQQR